MKNHSKFVYTLLYSVQKRNIWCIEYVFALFHSVYLEIIRTACRAGWLADWDDAIECTYYVFAFFQQRQKWNGEHMWGFCLSHIHVAGSENLENYFPLSNDALLRICFVWRWCHFWLNYRNSEGEIVCHVSGTGGDMFVDQFMKINWIKDYFIFNEAEARSTP